VLLIADLKHPERFYLIFTRPQWRSWLVRGAFIIGAYSAVLAAHVLASLAGATKLQRFLAVAGAPLAVATAAYTGYLFAQAKARDLWQNPMLPPHLVVQAKLAGAAVLLAFADHRDERTVAVLRGTIAATAAVHLALVAGEITLPHVTAHAKLAVRNLTRGPQRVPFWLGAALVGVSAFAPKLGKWAIPLALAGLAAYEDAYVRAGQSVPLA